MKYQCGIIATIPVVGLLAFALTVELSAGEKKGVLKVCLISGAAEYKSDVSLAKLQQHLEKNYSVKCSRAFAKSESDLPGLESLDTCDVAVLFTRRLKLEGDQLERIKKYCLSGKSLVGIRTASHGIQTWLDLDRDVFGGDYKNHYPEGPLTEIKLLESTKETPILDGVKPYKSAGSLYKNPVIAKDARVLMTGAISDHVEPIAWTRLYKGGRVFYTSLGHPKDFEEPSYLRLITNAVFWTAGRAPR
jgi:type 1 glutamine amidotransferase